jgi:hypothetical protein
MNRWEKKKAQHWEKEKSQLDTWKYYGSVGGADKDQMIKIVTWLLTISAGIVGFYATGKLKEASTALFSIGMGVSALAAVTALLYGGYAAWNWAIADRIAEKHGWREQCPTFRPITKIHWIDWVPLWLARPCDGKVAWVFWIFFAVSLASFVLHAWLLFSTSSSPSEVRHLIMRPGVPD